jgi:phage-related tail fiber protein
VSQIYFVRFTSAGNALLTAALAPGGDPVLIAEIGVTPTALPTPNDGASVLPDEIDRFPVYSREIVAGHPTQLKVKVVIPASVGDFDIRGLGLYDADGVLLAQANFPPTRKPLLVQGAEVTLPLSVILEHTNADTVFVTGAAGNVFMTESQVRELVSDELSFFRLTGY